MQQMMQMKQFTESEGVGWLPFHIFSKVLLPLIFNFERDLSLVIE